MAELYSFGYWVMRQRKALDLTRAELAKRINCASETIKKIERDERRPSLQIGELLAEALDVPPEERKLFLRVARGECAVDQLRLTTRPLASQLARRHNLPPQTTPFIGRDGELAEIFELLSNPGCRLLTIVGPGGCGKSRLALKAAESLIGQYSHGVYFVPLAGIKSIDILPGAIGRALDLDLQDPAGLKLLGNLGNTQREMLLVLDSFEHLVAAVNLINDLLAQAPGVNVIVTSSQRLNLQSEWVLQLGGLPFPPLGSAYEVVQYPAVVLFLQTARRLRGSFSLNEVDRQMVARICQLVEGLPLAVELAASWTRTLTCGEIAHEIENSLDILNTSFRDVPERHRNIRAVFDHSWKLLSEDEQLVLCSLSVFHGGFSHHSARHVTAASLTTLSALVDKSLIRLDHQLGGNQRYDLHELVRQYAGWRLSGLGESEAMRVYDRHLDYFVALAEQAEPELQGPNQLVWLDRLEGEYDNLRAAFAWAVDPARPSDGGQAQRLVNALHCFFCIRGHLDEACHWVDLALSSYSPDPAIRARLLWVAGFHHLYHGDRDLGRDLLLQSETLCRELRTAGKKDLAMALNFLGVESFGRDNLASAQAYYQESLALRRELRDAWGVSQSLNNLGVIADRQGDFGRERLLLEEGLAIARKLGERVHLIQILSNLGNLRFRMGDANDARTLYRQALALCWELRSNFWTAVTLDKLASIAALAPDENLLIRAVRLWGEAEALYKAHGTTAYQDAWNQRDFASIRQRLGEATFSSALADGRIMSMEQAIISALHESDRFN